MDHLKSDADTQDLSHNGIYDEDCFSDHISPEDYLMLRRSVGWSLFPIEEARLSLENSIVICIRKEGRPVAIGRVVTDKGYIVYIADIIVLPQYQGQGYGRKIMERIMKDIVDGLKPGYSVMVSLASAKGKEGFYEKFGFLNRHDDDVGHGMYQWIRNESKENGI